MIRKFLLQYHLELYTAVVLITVIGGILNLYSLSLVREMLLVIMVIGLFHEWEEKRIPGGFFETVGVVWGWDINNVDMRKPSRWVVYAWIVIIFIPLIFDNVIGLALAPMFLGVFELIIHSMGRFITKTKRIYFPGIITAWIMGIISICCIAVLVLNHMISTADVLIGAVFLVMVFVCLTNLVQMSAGSSLRRMIGIMKKRMRE